VLLDALVDYGGTLIFVSHDRYFVERLATKIVEVADHRVTLYPGTYGEFLWSKENGASVSGASGPSPTKRASTQNIPPDAARRPAGTGTAATASAPKAPDYAVQKRETAERRKREKAFKALHTRIGELEARIAEREGSIKALESVIAAPGFYEKPEDARPILDQHQHLMWEVGDLLSQWEMLQNEAEAYEDPKT
jgi:ATP-binding cassette, subfamily F, member 3